VIQKVPNKPTEIDLPDLSTTELRKFAHKDFYGLDKSEPVKAKEISLIS
jgi:hypothetical protein